jgi:transcription elongation factor SPT4
MRTLRACLNCSMIKSADQFEKFGCSNCDSFLHMKGNKARATECTTANFDG